MTAFNPQPKPVKGKRKKKLPRDEKDFLLQKEIPIVSEKLRNFARGKTCALNMPWCNNDTATTVHCHLRKFGTAGVNQKPIDIFGFHACSECHRRENEAGFEELLCAVMTTQKRLIQANIILVVGTKI